MDNTDYPKVRKAATKQGWSVESKADGEMFFSPDGVSKAHWLFTPSDRNAIKSFMRDLKRGGFIWPPSKRRK